MSFCGAPVNLLTITLIQSLDWSPSVQQIFPPQILVLYTLRGLYFKKKRRKKQSQWRIDPVERDATFSSSGRQWRLCSFQLGSQGEGKMSQRRRCMFSVILNLLHQLGFLQSWWSERTNSQFPLPSEQASLPQHHHLCFDFFFFHTRGALKL